MRISVIITILLLISTSASARYKYAASLFSTASTIYDARAHAMGRCEIMGANGSNAIFHNPAHIATQKGSQIQIGGFARKYKVDIVDIYQWSERSYSNDLIAELAQFSFSSSCGEIGNNIKMSYGIGINKFLDYSANEIYKRSHEYGNDRSYYYEDSEKTTGGLYCLSPSIAFNLQDILNIGITLNKSILSKRNGSSKYISEDNSERRLTIIDSEGDLKTTFVSFGLIFPVSNLVTLGAIFRSAMTIENDGEERHFTTSDDTTIVYTYNGNDKTIHATFGLSATYSLSKNLTLLGEYQTKDWGKHFGYGLESTYKSFPIRIGCFFDSNTQRDLFRKGITCGTGKNFGRFRIDLSGEYSWIKEILGDTRTTELREYENDKISMYSFNLNLSYFLK